MEKREIKNCHMKEKIGPEKGAEKLVVKPGDNDVKIKNS